MHEGFAVTALSMELATVGETRRFQSGFTIESHLEILSPVEPPHQLVFDTHVNALRHGRADAKRYISALVRERALPTVRGAVIW